MMLLLRPRGAGEPRGHRQQAALKDQRFRECCFLRCMSLELMWWTVPAPGIEVP